MRAQALLAYSHHKVPRSSVMPRRESSKTPPAARHNATVAFHVWTDPPPSVEAAFPPERSQRKPGGDERGMFARGREGGGWRSQYANSGSSREFCTATRTGCPCFCRTLYTMRITAEVDTCVAPIFACPICAPCPESNAFVKLDTVRAILRTVSRKSKSCFATRWGIWYKTVQRLQHPIGLSRNKRQRGCRDRCRNWRR